MATGKLTNRQLLARNISRGIASRGWSQRDLAREAGVDPKTVSNAVRMAGSTLGDKIAAIARALNTTTAMLLSEHYDPADITYPQVDRLVGQFLNAIDADRDAIMRVAEMARPRTNTR